jgi:hypothetical protein
MSSSQDTPNLDLLQAVATMRDCIGELAVASPKTLRDLAGELLGRRHDKCQGTSSACDGCHVCLTVARLLHVVAQTSEQKSAPVQCPVCGGPGTRDKPDLRTLDATCTVCGWHYTMTPKKERSV